MSETAIEDATGRPGRRRGVVVRVERLLFPLGVLCFAAIQFTLVLYPVLTQETLVWAGDAYSYLAKAEQMRTCPFQDCPALEDLRRQVSPSDDPTINSVRAKQYHRVLYIYHPLHSAFLILAQAVTGSWESAYKAVSVIGEIAVVAAIVIFLRSLWGRAAAGLALLFMATMVFPGFHGIHWIVPGNMALAVAFLIWVWAVRQWRGVQVVLPLGIAAMLGLHAVGQIYGAMAVVLYLASADRAARRTWLVAAAAVAPLAVYVLLPHFVARPTLAFRNEPLIEAWSYFTGVSINLETAWTMAGDWAARFGGIPVIALLVLAGLVATPPAYRRRVWIVGLVLAAVTAASLLFVMPGYPAEVFGRVWIPIVVFAIGAVGLAARVWPGRLIRSVGAFRRGGTRRAPAIVGLGAAAAVSVAAVFALVSNTVLGLGAVLDKAVDLYSHANYPVDTAQPARLFSGDAPTPYSVVYMSQLGLYLYLLRGGLDHGLVYYPAVANSPDERDWLSRARNIRYVVAAPEGGEDAGFAGWAPVGDGLSVAFLSRAPRSWAPAWLNLHSVGSAAVLRIDRVDAAGQPMAEMGVEVRVPADWSGWLPLPPGDAPASPEIRIHAVSPGARIFIKGLRLDGATALNWPWDQAIELRLPAQGAGQAGAPASTRTVPFESRDLIPSACASLGVVADAGTTVVVEVTCAAETETETEPEPEPEIGQ